MVDIEKIIPHRDRMRLVEEVVDIDNKSATTVSIVDEKWPLCDNKNVSCLVTIELVAQTSALAIGWEYHRDEYKDDVQGKGWLVGIKDALFYKENIPLETKIITQVDISLNMNNYTEVDGYTTTENEQLSKIKLQVLRMDKETDFE
jgi:predicted hotdog family 3-hydroxylacyl-ACP dehydratase